MWGGLRGDLLTLDRYESCLEATDAILANDCNSLTDALLSAGAVASKASEEERLAVEMSMIRQRRNEKLVFLWVEGSVMPTDVLDEGQGTWPWGFVWTVDGYTCRYRIRPRYEMFEERRSARERNDRWDRMGSMQHVVCVSEGAVRFGFNVVSSGPHLCSVVIQCCFAYGSPISILKLCSTALLAHFVNTRFLHARVLQCVSQLAKSRACCTLFWRTFLARRTCFKSHPDWGRPVYFGLVHLEEKAANLSFMFMCRCVLVHYNTSVCVVLSAGVGVLAALAKSLQSVDSQSNPWLTTSPHCRRSN